MCVNSSLKVSSLKLCVCVCVCVSVCVCLCMHACAGRVQKRHQVKFRVSIPHWTTSSMKSGHLCAMLNSLFPVQVGILSIYDGWMPG